MRVLAVLTLSLVSGSLAILEPGQGPPRPLPLPPPGSSRTGGTTAVVSPVAAATFVFRTASDGTQTLDLLVVWRGRT